MAASRPSYLTLDMRQAVLACLAAAPPGQTAIAMHDLDKRRAGW